MKKGSVSYLFLFILKKKYWTACNKNLIFEKYQCNKNPVSLICF